VLFLVRDIAWALGKELVWVSSRRKEKEVVGENSKIFNLKRFRMVVK